MQIKSYTYLNFEVIFQSLEFIRYFRYADVIINSLWRQHFASIHLRLPDSYYNI